MSATIDVVVLTKNSARLLRECLSSIYRNVPVGNLIIVDGYSTDATLEIVKEFKEKHEVTVIQQSGTRGSARQKAIETVETDWFAFIDSDVLLSNNWFAQAKKMIRDEVGAVWGIEIWSVLRNARELKLFERITMKIFEKRGGTHDLLVRRKAIQGISIPYYLHTYEDAFIKSWISRNGYKVIPTYEPYCIHFRPRNVWTLVESLNCMANDLRHAIRIPQLLLSYGIYAPIVLRQTLLHRLYPK